MDSFGKLYLLRHNPVYGVLKGERGNQLANEEGRRRMSSQAQTSATQVMPSFPIPFGFLLSGPVSIDPKASRRCRRNGIRPWIDHMWSDKFPDNGVHLTQ